jgi:hypothetical protein
MSEEKKAKAKPQVKAPAKDPVVYVLYRGDADIVDVVSGAETAMQRISEDRDVQFARLVVKRNKRNR